MSQGCSLTAKPAHSRRNAFRGPGESRPRTAGPRTQFGGEEERQMKHVKKISAVKASSIGDTLQDAWDQVLSFFKKGDED